MSRNAYSVKKNPHVWEKMQIEGFTYAIHLRDSPTPFTYDPNVKLLIHKQQEYYTQQRLVVYTR